MSSLQRLIEIQFQHGLKTRRLVVFIDLERPRVRGGLAGNQLQPHVINGGVESRSLQGVGNPFVGAFAIQEFVQCRQIIVRRQLVQG